MKKKFRVLIPIILALAIVFGSLSVSAVTKTVFTDYKVDYVNPESVSGIVKADKKFSFNSTVNGSKVGFEISFPSGGGIRINTDKTGYFSPESTLAISYDDIAEGTVRMNAENGTTAVFEVSGNVWTLQVLNSAKKSVFSLSSKQVHFGLENGTVKKVKIENDLSENEVIYGFGGRMNAVNQVGQSFSLWNIDGGDRDEDAYVNVPILNSTKGYTLFYNSTYGARADIGKTDPEIYTIDFNGDIFDAYIYTGSNSENMSAYTALTGRPVSAPKWALGYWAGQTYNHWVSRGSDLTYDYVKEVLENYSEMGTVPSTIYLETVTKKFENSSDYYELAAKYGVRVLEWNYPDVSDESLESLLEGTSKSNWPILKDMYNNYKDDSSWSIDYTNPLSKTVIKNIYSKLWSFGLSGLMVDYGEYIAGNALAYNGKTGPELHNLMPLYYCKAQAETWDEGLNSKDYILFARAGCAGCQAYTANFTGDQYSTWIGLEDQVQILLSLSASGFNLTGGDIGGFFGDPTSELYMRWVEVSTFFPLMRAHGDNSRNPWSFGSRAKTVFTDHYWLRENITDLIYSATLKGNKTGVPMVQSMPAAFPDDATVSSNETQYMFCDNLLVCPVVDDSVVLLDVVLPEGKWYDLWSGTEYVGSNSAVKVDANTNRIPVYIKSGAAFPVTLSDNFQLTDEIKESASNKTLLVTPPEKDEESVIYSDDGEKVYKNSLTENGGFKITAEDGGDTKYLLIYGQNVTDISVDGTKLSEISKSEIKTKAGYYIDGANRTVVSLPSDSWKEITVNGKSMHDMAKGCSVYTAAGTEIVELTDGDITTDSLITNKMKSLTVDLGSEKTVSQIALKWGKGYASDYVIQASADGENWTEIYTSKNGDGGTEYISVEPTTVRYISVGSLKKAAGQQMRMHSIEVFGDDSGTVSGDTDGISTTAIIIIVSVIAVCAVSAAVVVMIFFIKKKKKLLKKQ